MNVRHWIDRVIFKEILHGLRLTFRHLFVKEVTLQYPHQQLPIPDTHRGALCLLRYDDGEERCVGCDLCEAVCPSNCIKVVSGEILDGQVVRRYATAFDIDITKCVFCGFCVEACPVNALGMTKMYAYSTANKRTLIFDKPKLYEVGETHFTEAKAYLVAHNQEKDDEAARTWRYRFPPHFNPNAPQTSHVPQASQAPPPERPAAAATATAEATTAA